MCSCSWCPSCAGILHGVNDVYQLPAQCLFVYDVEQHITSFLHYHAADWYCMEVVPCRIFVFTNVRDEFCWGVVPNMNASVFLVDVPRFPWPSRFLILYFYLTSGRARSPSTSEILFFKSPRCTALLPLSRLPEVLRAVAVCTSCIPAFSPHL
jgi:hypothetical protein